ncbi:MAG: hypothetical protein WB995_02030 [Candidatus Acidiferrales bacterium]
MGESVELDQYGSAPVSGMHPKSLVFATSSLLAVALLLIGVAAFAIAGAPKEQNPISTKAVDCIDKPSQALRSPIVFGPTGNRAFAEVRCNLVGAGTPVEWRTYIWSLHLAASGKPFSDHEVWRTRDSNPAEAQFEVFGWSADGNNLLTATVMAAGDWDETIPAIYSLRDDKVWRVPLEPLFKRIVAPKCLLHFDPLGFSRDGMIGLDVMDLETPYLDGQKPCIERGTWLLDFRSSRVRRASAQTKFTIIARIEQ